MYVRGKGDRGEGGGTKGGGRVDVNKRGILFQLHNVLNESTLLYLTYTSTVKGFKEIHNSIQ